MRIDLHTHSSVSDGTDAPGEVIRQAKAAGVTMVALTDHDSMNGYEEAARAAAEAGIGLVRGMEVSCTWEGSSLHVLAFGVDPSPTSPLAERLTQIRLSRLERAEKMVSALAKDFPITWESVQAIARDERGSHSVGRPHIADALVRAGVVEDRAAAFSSMLASGSPYYVRYESFSAEEALRAIHEAQGVAVAAHVLSPGRGARRTAESIRGLIDAGLDGLEVYHREHSDAEREELLALAREGSLLVTGGSDYHGTGKPNRIGENVTTLRDFEALAERLAPGAVLS